MPTLFENLDVALDGNELATRLPEQISKLKTAADTIVGLIQDPPDSLADFSQILNELPLPDLLGGDFASSLSSLQSALPEDLSSVVGSLVNGLSQLQSTVSADLARILDDALTAIRAIYRLTQIDYTCSEQVEPGSSGTGGSSEGGSSGSGGASGGSGGSSGGGASGGGSGGSSSGGSSGGGNGGASGSGGNGSSSGASENSGITETSNQIKAVNSALDGLPSPFNVENFLGWLKDVVAVRYKQNLPSFTLPIIDDIIDPITTLTTWHSLDADQLRDNLAQSMQDLVVFIRSTVYGLTSTLASNLSATASQLEVASLSQIADSLTARLHELQAAVNDGDISGATAAVNEINARLDSYETLRSTMQTGLLSILPSLNSRLGSLTDDMVSEMGHLVSVLRPNPAIGEIANAFPEAPDLTDTTAAIEGQFQPLADWIEELTNQLDIEAIQEPLSAVANAARTAVDGLEQGLAQVVIQVRAIFGELESLLDEIDTESLVDQIEDAIDDFGKELIEKIKSLFKPVQDAVSQIISNIDGQIDAFSPEDIVDALTDLITQLTSVLEDPAVVSAVNEVRETLESVKTQVEELSFAPLTNQVISGMEDISDALQNIDTSALDSMLQAALSAALAILPDDLKPLTDPLIDEFGDMIESGPVPVLELVKAQPEKLLNRVRSFEPATLIGDSLSKPYDDLLSRMEEFKPSSLLGSVDDELDKTKKLLEDKVDPGQLIELLEPVFNQLLSSLDRFKPEDLVKPLSDAVSETINAVLDVLPVDEFMDQIDAVLGVIEDIVGVGEEITSMFQKINQVLAGLADSENQMTEWVNSILSKVESISDLGPLEIQFSELSTALDETKASALTTVLQSAITPLLTSLETLDPETRHATLVQTYSSFPRSALEALGDSAEKTAILAALDRFDPLDPGFGRPYQVLLTYKTALSQTQTDLQAALADWDSHYHSADGTIAEFRITNVTAAQIRNWLQEEMDASFLEPLKTLLGMVEVAASPLNLVFTQITNLVTALQSKIDDLLLGPDSLGGIRDALDSLIQRLRDFNLDFLTESLEEIFSEILEKVNGVNPAQFKETLNTSFKNMLDTISLNLIIPAADLETLDDSFEDLIDKLKALSPEELVTKAVQPEYEEKVVPLIDTFDVTELLEAIIERLRSLDEELKDEMKRVDTAFGAMKDSVPALSGAVSISL